MDTQEAIKTLCAFARENIDPDRIARAKERQAAAFRWDEAESIPLIFGDVPAEIAELHLPEYDWREQFEDPAKSFMTQLRNNMGMCAVNSDAVPSLRADTGVVNGPSVFGAKYAVPTHTKPIVNEYVPKETLRDFSLPDDITGLGTMPTMIEHMQHHVATLKEHGLDDVIKVTHCDIQGPFDIAEQARGHEMLTDFYEDPEFVHHLMAQATKVYVAIGRLCKDLAGDPGGYGNANGRWMNPGGVRMCDDSGILLAPKVFEEFVLPYQIQGFEAFGGGWLHYCGGVPQGGRMEGIHLHDLYLSNPGLRGLNFTTGQDLTAEIRKVIAAKVNYVGGFPREDDESLDTYLRRAAALCPGRKGMQLSPSILPDERAGAMDLWMQVQDELFGAA